MPRCMFFVNGHRLVHSRVRSWVFGGFVNVSQSVINFLIKIKRCALGKTWSKATDFLVWLFAATKVRKYYS